MYCNNFHISLDLVIMFWSSDFCLVLASILLSVLSARSDTNDNVLKDEVTVIVNTANGQVRGHKAYTLFDEKIFYTFKGIPYAEPPVGSLRFKVGFYVFIL